MNAPKDLIEKFNEKHKQSKIKYAVFTFPIINGLLYLAVRNTPPLVGLYSAIGGKVDPYTEEVPQIQLPISPGTDYVTDQGYERLKWTSLRETVEELYNLGEELTPNEIQTIDFTTFSISDYLTLFDANTGVTCYSKIVGLPTKFQLGNKTIETLAFNPSKREIGDINPVSNIPLESINPLTKVALYLLRLFEGEKIKSLIPQVPEIKVTFNKDEFIGPIGDNFRYHADIHEAKGFYFDYKI